MREKFVIGSVWLYVGNLHEIVGQTIDGLRVHSIGYHNAKYNLPLAKGLAFESIGKNEQFYTNDSIRFFLENATLYACPKHLHDVIPRDVTRIRF